jgi:hypothetical protein
MVIALFQKLPPGWPRVLMVGLLAAAMFTPQLRQLLTGGKVQTKRMDQAKRMLEIRKLQMEVEALEATHGSASSADDAVKRAVESALENSLREDPEDAPPPPYVERLRYAALGALAFFIVTALLATIGGVSGPDNSLTITSMMLRSAVVSAISALLAAALPARVHWASALFGFLIPILIGALAAFAR